MTYYFRKDLLKKSENRIFVERKRTTLALNESFFSVLNIFNEEEKKLLLNSNVNKYPTEEYVLPLLNSIKNYCGVNSIEQILIANGIDELLYYLFISMNEKGSKCIVNVPTYPDYKNYGQSVGMSFIEIPLIENQCSNAKNNEENSSSEFSLDIKKIIKIGKRKDVKAIIFTNPNNPTGAIFNISDIIYVTQKLLNKLIIIDEAYIEFCPEKSVVSVLGEFPNLVVLRTFSKGFLSPGLRLGYLLSNQEIIRELKKVFPVFPVSQFSLEFGKILLSKLDEIKKIREEIILNREKIYNELLEIKQKGNVSKVYKSNTNFILFKFEKSEDMNKFYNYLIENDISIRNVSGKFLSNALRVTASNNEESELFIKLLIEFFNR